MESVQVGKIGDGDEILCRHYNAEYVCMTIMQRKKSASCDLMNVWNE